VEHFREDLRKMLGLVPTTIKLTWDQGFEEFLREEEEDKDQERGHHEIL
jgi:hypothetical protein